MRRLKSRNTQIQGCFQFHIPELNWTAQRCLSFSSIVEEVMKQVAKNPWLAGKNTWPTDRAGIEQWVEDYQVKLCEARGWTQYLTEAGESPPKWLPPSQLAKLSGKLAVGAKALLAWLGEGGEPVAKELSARRSSVCANCPLNLKQSLKDIFTVPAAELIRRQIEFAHECQLSTPNDESLGICDACGCPMRLKVHCPIGMIPDNEKVWENCWIRHEKLPPIPQ